MPAIAPVTQSEFKSVCADLRKLCPVPKGSRVYCELADLTAENALGLFYSMPSGNFRITIHYLVPYDFAVYLLIHEFAHLCQYLRYGHTVDDHSAEFGIDHARLHQLYFNVH